MKKTMDAKEYIDTLRRICSTDYFCDNCDFKKNGTCPLDKRFLLLTPSEDIVSSVEQWAKDHPVKTRQSEFLKMFPNAEFCQDVINILPCSIEKEMCKCCDDRECEECRKDYWLTEVTDND